MKGHKCRYFKLFDCTVGEEKSAMIVCDRCSNKREIYKCDRCNGRLNSAYILNTDEVVCSNCKNYYDKLNHLLSLPVDSLDKVEVEELWQENAHLKDDGTLNDEEMVDLLYKGLEKSREQQKKLAEAISKGVKRCYESKRLCKKPA